MVTLAENTPVGAYKVHRFIKKGLYNDSYVVKDEEGHPFFMKLFDLSRIPAKMLVDGTVEEIVLSRQLKHDHVISYVADGTVPVEGTDCQFLVTQYFNGQLLSETLRAGRLYTPTEAKGITHAILSGLRYLHTQGLCHNDLTPRNIFLEEAEDGAIVPKIIDLGHLGKPTYGAPPFPVEDLNVEYVAPEALKGGFSQTGDVFSVAAILYTMLYGHAPWPCEDVSETEPYFSKKKKARKARMEPLVFPDLPEPPEEALMTAMKMGLMLEVSARPDSKQFLDILLGKEIPEKKDQDAREAKKVDPEVKADSEDKKLTIQKNRSGKGGFADVAGMDQLKKELTNRVIWVLRNKAKAAEYRLLPPNGMLLYGPPGCGKTFFAQKFAEETGFHYFLVKGSDLGSTYIHGTQNKIAELFKTASEKAPCVICFDEFDSFVPARGTDAARHRPEEVNEFLSQLNNCAERGIFVIGTTNRMDMIDPAVLRKGRMDLHYEIPAPDQEARKAMFAIHLKGRPCSEDIDLERLAELTAGYASSDIAFIVNESAMVAALGNESIGQRILEESVRCNPSSLAKKLDRIKIGF